MMADFRIGHGYDVHRFCEGRRLVLGGVEIPYSLGLLGHSDADVLTHAVMDALLGAVGMGDIGRHFPDSSEEFRGISSMILLGEVKKKLDSLGYSVGNIDATLVIQAPRISPYVEEMKSGIAAVLGVDADRVNIKATTEEHLGFTGSGEGAAAHAVALVYSKE
jgi:2-C-methyl-D-erythritol 2,4-cyclodiphosphate synthase